MFICQTRSVVSGFVNDRENHHTERNRTQGQFIAMLKRQGGIGPRTVDQCAVVRFQVLHQHLILVEREFAVLPRNERECQRTITIASPSDDEWKTINQDFSCVTPG